MNSSLLSIQAIADKLDLADTYLEPFSLHSAKLKLELLNDSRYPRRGKLILVTGTTPTKRGEGKTVVSIGLTQALDQLGHRAIVTSREPSLGPIFGIKGGGVGGGRSQLEPSQKINLHFHGDFHAITSAHNLLTALLDAHLFHGNALNLDLNHITWPRTIDMNDRALRRIQIGLGETRRGVVRETGFVATAASEIMAILGLATSRADLRRRLNAIVVGFTDAGNPVRAADLDATGAMLVLLNDALLPNLVQTTEGTPALVHTGPFANIAHGTSSVLSQEIGLRLADFVVNETGFGTELGAEKYFNLVMRSSNIVPAAAVLVTTVPGLRMQGQGDLELGLANLANHLQILRRFRVPIVVAVNRFPDESEADVARVIQFCAAAGSPAAVVEAFANGGAGAIDLAEKVVHVVETDSNEAVRPLYPLDSRLEDKIGVIAQHVYGAKGVVYSDQARHKLQQFTDLGFGDLPICIAKTQRSISDDPALLGAPTEWTLRISDAVLSAGAGFVVVLAGDMLLMPGLPKVSRAAAMDVDDAGNIIGV